MYKNIRHHELIFEPAAVGANETKALLQVKKGDRVLFCHAEKQVLAAAATDTTVTLGDTGDPDGLITAIDTETGAVGDLLNGAGAYMIGGGKLFIANGTIDAVYAGTTYGATKPRIKFHIGIVEKGL